MTDPAETWMLDVVIDVLPSKVSLIADAEAIRGAEYLEIIHMANVERKAFGQSKSYVGAYIPLNHTGVCLLYFSDWPFPNLA